MKTLKYAKEIKNQIKTVTDKDVLRKLKQDIRNESRGYTWLKRARWAVLTNSHNLSESGEEVLNDILKLHSDLATCYSMKEEKIKVIKYRKKRYSSYLGELSTAVENIVNRDFLASSPNEKWLTDISEFATSKGKIYLSVIRDCYNDEIISYKIGNKPTAALANDTLSEAIKSLGDSRLKPIIHSDRGCHYRWSGWIQITEDNGLVRSMSKKGCSPDNSACERFFGRMKTECFYNHSLEDLSLEELKIYMNRYIQWYNNDRIKNTLGGLSPVQYRLNREQSE